jgi:hypothetical protein
MIAAGVDAYATGYRPGSRFSSLDFGRVSH